jgi:hypothetical protein
MLPLEINLDKDYNFLKTYPLFISQNCNVTDIENNNTNSVEDFCKLYINANEIVNFPKIKEHNKACVIYAHYDEDNIIKDYVIQSLRILTELQYDVFFYTTSTKILNINEYMFPYKINYVKNLGPGTDYHIWLNCLNKIKQMKNSYEWIMLVNDSLLLGINGVNNMKNTIKNMREQNIDLWGHWDSRDVNYHYLGVPIEFSNRLLDFVVNFMSQRIQLCKTFWDYVIHIETKLIQTKPN